MGARVGREIGATVGREIGATVGREIGTTVGWKMGVRGGVFCLDLLSSHFTISFTSLKTEEAVWTS